jgi:hypothetical protein
MKNVFQSIEIGGDVQELSILKEMRMKMVLKLEGICRS